MGFPGYRIRLIGMALGGCRIYTVLGCAIFFSFLLSLNEALLACLIGYGLWINEVPMGFFRLIMLLSALLFLQVLKRLI